MDRAALSPTRRNILIGAAGLAVAGIIATARLVPSVEQRTRRMLASNRFTRQFLSLAEAEQAEWAAQVGSVFTIEGGYRLKLAGVQPLPSTGRRPAELRDRAFAAVFEVLGGATMSGDLIYTASHSQYGSLPLFLSVTGSPSRMIAVFN